MNKQEFREYIAAHPELQERGLVPFKPVLDWVLVHEEPIEQNRVISRLNDDLDIVASQHYAKGRTYRGTVVAIGDGVPMGGVLMPIPYRVGDQIRLGEFGGERFFMRSEDEHSTDKSLPIYWLYRVADTLGKDLA